MRFSGRSRKGTDFLFLATLRVFFNNSQKDSFQTDLFYNKSTHLIFDKKQLVYLLKSFRSELLHKALLWSEICSMPRNRYVSRCQLLLCNLCFIQGPFTLYVIFLISILLIACTNGLYRTQWKCSHYATATTSPTPI